MLSKRLKELRSNTTLTQQEFADKIEVARTTYAMYEQGKREPDNSILNRIADYYDVSTDFLLGRTDIKTRFDPSFKYPEFSDLLSDPVLLDFLKTDLKDITPEKLEQLRAMWKIMNS